jgi:putative ABC transport system substrate-binding protein
MRRRTMALLITLALGLLVAPLATEVQPAGYIARIGVLDLGYSAPAAVELQHVFRQALRELGWVEGHNLTVESRWSEGDRDQLRDLAAELASR